MAMLRRESPDGKCAVTESSVMLILRLCSGSPVELKPVTFPDLRTPARKSQITVQIDGYVMKFMTAS